MIPSPLGDEIEGAPLPLAKSLRAKHLRLLPDARIVVGAIQIQQHLLPLGEGIAFPLKIVPHQRPNHGKEGIESPYLLYKHLRIIILASLQLLATRGMLVQGHSGERDKDRHGHGWSQHVEQFHSRHMGAQQIAVQVPVPGNDVGRALLRRREAAGADIREEARDPPIGSVASQACLPVLRPDRSRFVEQGGQFVRTLADLRLRERNARPGTYGPAQEPM